MGHAHGPRGRSRPHGQAPCSSTPEARPVRAVPRRVPRGAGGLGPAVGGSDLTFSHDLRQIRLATPLAPRSVGVKAADQERYSGRNALAVPLQTDRESVKAFEQERGRKTARLQQRRQAGG